MHGYMIVGCALFTMVLGLDIWFKTLKTRENLAVVWNQQTSTTQSLLQQSVCLFAHVGLCFLGKDTCKRQRLTVNHYSFPAAATPIAHRHHL